MSEERGRTLRAMFLNAAAWSIAWGAAGGAIVTVMGLFSRDPGIESLPERIGMALFGGISLGVRFAIAGAVIGTLFSGIIRWGYRGKRLADISPFRFAILGAIVGGLGVPLFLQTMNVVFGDGPIAWNLVGDDGIWASVFGAVVAAGSIFIARRASALPRELQTDLLEHGDEVPAALPSRSARPTAAAPHDRTHPTP